MSTIRLKHLVELAIPQLFFWAFIFQWIAGNNPYFQLITHLLITIIVGIWLIISMISNAQIKPPDISVPVVVLLIYQVFSILRAPLIWNGFVQVYTAVFTFIIFVFFVNFLDSSWRTRVWENSLLGIGGFLSTFNLSLVAIRFMQWRDLNASFGLSLPFRYRLPGAFLNHPNVEAAFLNLLVPILIARLILTRKNTHKLWFFSITLLFLCTLYFTSSRGAWVAGIIGIGTMVLLILVAYIKDRGINLAATIRRISPTSISIIFSMTIVFVLLLAYSFIRLVQSTGRPALWGSRSAPWTIGWKLLTEAPIFGHGAGSAQFLIALDKTIPPEPYLVHTHNIFLQIGSEFGLVGIILFTWILVRLGIKLYSAFQASDFDMRVRLSALAGIFISSLIHHLVDYFFNAPIYAITLVFFIASLYTLAPIRTKDTFQLKFWRWVVPIVGIFILIIGLYSPGSIAHFRAITEFEQEVSLDSGRELCQLQTRYPYRTFFAFSCGRVMAELADNTRNPAHLTTAIQAYRSGLDADPYWPVHWANMAGLEREAGMNSDALAHMQRALDSGPDYAVFNFNYGRMIEASGNPENAFEYYRKAIAAVPSMLELPYFDSSNYDPDDFVLDTFYLSDFPANNHAQAGWYYLYRDELDAARNEFARAIEINPAQPYARAGLAFLELQEGEIGNSELHIKVALYSKAEDPLIQYVAGKIAFAEGDLSEGKALFEGAINLFRYANFSVNYYNVVYQGQSISPDTVPQLSSVFLSKRALNDFSAYAASIQVENPIEAKSIQDLITSWSNE